MPVVLIRDEMLEALVEAWPKLQDADRRRLVVEAEVAARGKPHKSTLPPVEVGKTDLVHVSKVAEYFGIKQDTLRFWEAQGWIAARKTVAGRKFYTRKQFTAAKRKWKRRRAKK